MPRKRRDPSASSTARSRNGAWRAGSVRTTSRACGISNSTYRRLEKGDLYSVPLWMLTNCALALGVDVDALIEPAWREWRNTYGTSPAPPEPAGFWRRDPDS
ncbi:MAG: helix-turn-helix transcriptional regulator [Solirubrobacteraceae bacterium]|jgi:hypothetical protein